MISYFESNLIKSWPNYILITTGIILSFYEYKISNIGFDLSDEGYSLSKFRFPQEVKATISRDHLYSSMLFEFLEFDVSKLRKANLLLLIFSSYILASGLNAYVKKNFHTVHNGKMDIASYLCFILICQLPSLWIERVPSYNNTTSFIALCTFGLILKWHSRDKDTINIFILITVGILLGMSIIIRPPSGITGIILFAVIISFRENKINNFIFYTLGIVTALILHFVLMESPLLFYEVTKEGFSFHASLETQKVFLILRYFNEIWGNLKFVLLANKFEIFISCIIFSILLKNKMQKRSYVFCFTAFIYISVRHFNFGDLHGGHGLYWPIWRFYIAQFVIFSFLLITYLIASKVNLKKMINKDLFLIPIILLITPVWFAFGTSNLITFNMNFYTSFFFIGILLLLLFILKYKLHNVSSFFLQVVLLLFSIGPCYAYINGRMFTGLYTISESSGGKISNNTELLVSSNSKLRVTSATKSATEALCDELNKHKKGIVYLLNFSTMPGLNYLCDLPHPIQPWTVHMKQSRNFTLENINRTQFNNSAILYRSKDLEILEQLQKFFPNWKSTHYNSKDIVYYINDKKVSLTLHLPKDE